MGLLDRFKGKETTARGGGEIDPVCKMTVDPATAPAKAVHAGKTYYFCAPGCKTSFERDPHRYLGAHAH